MRLFSKRSSYYYHLLNCGHTVRRNFYRIGDVHFCSMCGRESISIASQNRPWDDVKPPESTYPKVEIDWSGSGLVVQLITERPGCMPMVDTYANVCDASGHFTEKFIGAMARRITELENQINASSDS